MERFRLGVLLPISTFLCFCVSCAAPPAASGGDGGATPASSALERLLEDAWQFRLREDPLLATRAGDHRYDHLLPAVSEPDQQRRLQAERDYLERLLRIPKADLSHDEQVSYDVFRRLAEDRIREAEFRTYRIPITNREGFHVSFPQLPDETPLATVADYEHYIARLEGFLAYERQHVALMREGIATGWVLPRVVLEGIEGALQAHIVEQPQQSLLYRPFQDFPDSLPAEQRGRLEDAGRRAIQQSVVPGYREFLQFMRDEYLPAARPGIAASDLPGGREYYAFKLRSYTTLDLTPEQVHATGQSEVARIQGEMQGVMARVGFSGSIAAFADALRNDPRFHPRTPEELMQRTAYVLKKMDGELPKLFATLPRMPYGIKPIPDFIAPKTTTAYYDAPAGDGTRAGFYAVNLYDLPSRPLYEVEALSLHEAVPGHHLQIALQQELEDLPAFRRFDGFTVFVEGWALYAERLGLEVGFYQDPYSDFGRLTYEMWRACRLVVDTGMHALGWSRQQAIDFMLANTALSRRNIEAEVDRYISWPGQALAYKTGELRIRELRARAERELGPRFDLRVFHDVVLRSGSVPLDVLEQNVTRWIEESR
ncbi:MAG: DUF885 domain-containing protein [Planctomycetota bacterium]|nr:MAG: DUF885 domain-containing protein [Planctomycetota bacterium]